MIQDLYGLRCIKESDEFTLVADSSVPLMYLKPDKSWITNPDYDHPKGTRPKRQLQELTSNNHLLPLFPLSAEQWVVSLIPAHSVRERTSCNLS